VQELDISNVYADPIQKKKREKRKKKKKRRGGEKTAFRQGGVFVTLRLLWLGPRICAGEKGEKKKRGKKKEAKGQGARTRYRGEGMRTHVGSDSQPHRFSANKRKKKKEKKGGKGGAMTPMIKSIYSKIELVRQADPQRGKRRGKRREGRGGKTLLDGGSSS